MARPRDTETTLRAKIRSLQTMLSRERFRMAKAFEIAEAAITAVGEGDVKEARRIVTEGCRSVEAEAGAGEITGAGESAGA